MLLLFAYISLVSKGLLQPLQYPCNLRRMCGVSQGRVRIIFPSHCERHPFSPTVTIPSNALKQSVWRSRKPRKWAKGKVVIGILAFLPHPRDCFNPICTFVTSNKKRGFARTGSPLFRVIAKGIHFREQLRSSNALKQSVWRSRTPRNVVAKEKWLLVCSHCWPTQGIASTLLLLSENVQ